MMKRSLIFAGLFAGLCAYGADRYWTNAASGTWIIDDPANWYNLAPPLPSGDNARFTNAMVNVTLTLTNNFGFGNTAYFRDSPQTITMDLGGYTFAPSGFNLNSTVDILLTNGTLNLPSNFYLNNNDGVYTGNNRLTVVDTGELIANEWYLGQHPGGARNWLRFVDGGQGTIKSRFFLGNNTGASGGLFLSGSSTLVKVMGTQDSYVGNNGQDNILEIANKATLDMNAKTLQVADKSTSGGNLVFIHGGGIITNVNTINLQGWGANSLVVSNNGVFYGGSLNIYQKVDGMENVAEFVDGGKGIITSFSIAQTSNSTGGVLRLSGAGTCLTVYNSNNYVGREGQAGLIEISDGALMTMTNFERKIILGSGGNAAWTSHWNSIVVRDGGVLSNANLAVGEGKGTMNSIIVSNAAIYAGSMSIQGSSNRILVADGGKWHALTSGFGISNGDGNSFTVTGEESELAFIGTPAEMNIGTSGSRNVLLLDTCKPFVNESTMRVGQANSAGQIVRGNEFIIDGVDATVLGSLHGIGSSIVVGVQSDANALCESNTLRVVNGATLYLKNGITVGNGNSNSSHNLLVVEDSSVAGSGEFKIGDGASYNGFVMARGSLNLSNNSVKLSPSSSGWGNYVNWTDSVITNASDLRIGGDGHSSLCTLTNSYLYVNQINFGSDGNGKVACSNNTLIVADRSVVTCGDSIRLRGGADSRLILENATIIFTNTSSSLRLGEDGDMNTNQLVSIRGTNSLIHVNSYMYLAKDAGLEFVVPRKGYLQTPVMVHQTSFKVGESRLIVKAKDWALHTGGELTLYYTWNTSTKATLDTFVENAIRDDAGNPLYTLFVRNHGGNTNSIVLTAPTMERTILLLR